MHGTGLWLAMGRRLCRPLVRFWLDGRHWSSILKRARRGGVQTILRLGMAVLLLAVGCRPWVGLVLMRRRLVRVMALRYIWRRRRRRLLLIILLLLGLSLVHRWFGWGRRRHGLAVGGLLAV